MIWTESLLGVKGLATILSFYSFQGASPTPPPQNCTASGGKCVGPNKCNNSVVLAGVFDCKGKRVCCKVKDCHCVFKPNCKPIIARVPISPNNCPKGDVCCEHVDIPTCPGTCLDRKQCKSQGGTVQPRPHDCPRRKACCILWWSAGTTAIITWFWPSVARSLYVSELGLIYCRRNKDDNGGNVCLWLIKQRSDDVTKIIFLK